MWDLPGPGIKPVSPALAGGFLTTAPPGKPFGLFLVRRGPYFTFPEEPAKSLSAPASIAGGGGAPGWGGGR